MNSRIVSRGDCDLNALISVLPRLIHHTSRSQESYVIWIENVESDGETDSNVSGSLRSEETLFIHRVYEVSRLKARQDIRMIKHTTMNNVAMAIHLWIR